MTSYVPAHHLSNHLQIHGHRGCRGLYPENTLPAFLHALRLGVDVLEMDVVLSADQQVVVTHEPWLSAQLGFSPTGQPIDPQYEREFNLYRMPYADIQRSPVGILPHPAFPGQQQLLTHRPLLREVLAATESAWPLLGRAPVGYSIEIKSTPETEQLFHPAPQVFTERVLAAIPKQLIPRTTLLCFDPRVLQAARVLLPTLRLCLLVETSFEVPRVFQGLGFIPDVLGPSYELLLPAVVASLHQHYPQLQLVPWTVNEPTIMHQLRAMGITGLTTDYPNLALATFQNSTGDTFSL